MGKAIERDSIVPLRVPRPPKSNQERVQAGLDWAGERLREQTSRAAKKIVEFSGADNRLADIEQFLTPFETKTNYGRVLINVLPGGLMPERKTEGAIGFDVGARAIVSPFEMEADGSGLRKSLFNFVDRPHDEKLAAWVRPDDQSDGKLMLEIPPGESALVGIGVATAMEYPMFFWLSPRSGLSSKYRVTLANTPGTVDPDYRGEAGAVLVNDGDQPWALRHQDRIAQMIFTHAIIPELELVEREKMPQTMRGSGGFGSTGVEG